MSTLICHGEYLSVLPKNVIFNKAKTGCGGTTLALTNDENYVVCVPYVNAIKSKLQSSREHSELYNYEVLGIYSGVSEDEVLSYLKRNQGKPLKIIITYESLSKIIEREWIDPKRFNLLVDEYHCLIREYVFRNKGVSNVLTLFRTFMSYTFMSATPVFEDDFVLNELKSIPITTAVWNTTERYRVTLNLCKKGLLTPVAHLINQYIDGKMEGNLYLFVNSLQMMKKLVNHPDIDGRLSEENTKLIASANSIRELPFKGGSLTDGCYKKINMLTSTAFESVDINDEEGRAVIIADSRLDYTLFDTSTTLIQILGRLRKSRFRNEVHIYVRMKTTGYELDYASYKELLLHEKDRIEKSLITLSKLPKDQIEKKIKSSFFDLGFIEYKDGIHKFDNNFLSYKLWKYRITHWIFNKDENLENSIASNINFSIERKEVIDIIEKTPSQNPGHFKVCAERLWNLRHKGEFLRSDIIYGNRFKGLSKDELEFVKSAIKRFPYIIRALTEIGLPKMRHMGFNTSNIQRKLTISSDLQHKDKIRELLSLRNLTGKYISSKEARVLMGDIYRQVGVPKKPKSTDLKHYFQIIPKKKQRSRGYLIGELKNIKE